MWGSLSFTQTSFYLTGGKTSTSPTGWKTPQFPHNCVTELQTSNNDSQNNKRWKMTDHKWSTMSYVPSSQLKILHALFCLKNWNIVDSECCVNFYCSAKWFHYTNIYIYIYILFHILFYYGLLQNIEYSYLCYIIEPSCLFILYVIVWSPNPNLI